MLALHARDQMPDPEAQPFYIFPGKEYTVLTTIHRTVADEGLADLSVEKRKCLMADEMSEEEGFLLRNRYSQSLCLLQQKFSRAIDVMECIPWNAPYWAKENKSLRMCDKMETVDFFAAVNRNTLKSKDECKAACDELRYEYALNWRPLKAESFCKQITRRGYNANYVFNAFTPLEVALNGLQSVADLDSYMNDPTFFACVMQMRRTSVISIRAARTRASVAVLRKRVSFSSTLASTGIMRKLF